MPKPFFCIGFLAQGIKAIYNVNAFDIKDYGEVFKNEFVNKLL